MPTPHRAAVVDGPTPASALILERRLLAAYHALYQAQVGQLWPPDYRKRQAVAALGGNLAPTQVRHAEQRLREAMPELIQRLTLEQQPQVAAVLLTPAPDLAQVVALLVKLERNLNYRDDDPRLAFNDDARLKAAGMGHLSKAIYGTLPKLGPPLELTPWRPVLRTKKKPAACVRPRLRKQRRETQYVREQLCFEFPSGGVTLAAL